MQTTIFQHHLDRGQLTLSAYRPDLEILRVLATSDFSGLIMITSPVHSELRSVEPQTGHTLPLDRLLHFLQACSRAIFQIPILFLAAFQHLSSI